MILHVAAPLWEYLRDKYAETTTHPGLNVMMGTPVVVEDALTGGQWEFRDNGQIVKSGDLAPATEDGKIVSYMPGFGWVEIDPRIRRTYPEDRSPWWS